MSEDDQKALYMSLLRGVVAKDAQDQLCAADQGHAWSEWTRYQVRHDVDDITRQPLSPGDTIPNLVIHVRAERRCLNCGKEQQA